MNGLLMEGDTLSLSNEFILNTKFLIDAKLSAKHHLSKRAFEAITLLQSPIKLEDWLSNSQLRKDEVVELVAFLNHIGALRVKRSVISSCVAWFKRIGWTIAGASVPALTFRREANIGNTITATLRSTGWIWGTWPFMLILIYGTGAFNLPRFTVLSGTALLTILASLVAHELTHVYVVWRSGQEPSVMQQGMRLGILHQRLSPKNELWSALSGPLAGSTTCVACAILGQSVDPALVPLCLLACSLHLASWLPWYGDGQTIFHQLKVLRS